MTQRTQSQIVNYFELNMNDDITYEIFWDVDKTDIRGKFTIL